MGIRRSWRDMGWKLWRRVLRSIRFGPIWISLLTKIRCWKGRLGVWRRRIRIKLIRWMQSLQWRWKEFTIYCKNREMKTRKYQKNMSSSKTNSTSNPNFIKNRCPNSTNSYTTKTNHYFQIHKQKQTSTKYRNSKRQ